MLVTTKLPRLKRLRRGDFGEAFAIGLLEEIDGYQIPVRKLYFKVTGSQSMPSTDALALKTNAAGRVAEVCFVESKLRSGTDRDAAVHAAEQLAKDYAQRYPDLLRFVLERLSDLSSDLFKPFLEYTADREHGDSRDTFCVALHWEASKWEEVTLSNLQEYGPPLSPLTVRVVRIENLVDLVNKVFSQLGAPPADDDDEF
jgi:hypothetical protein